MTQQLNPGDVTVVILAGGMGTRLRAVSYTHLTLPTIYSV